MRRPFTPPAVPTRPLPPRFNEARHAPTASPAAVCSWSSFRPARDWKSSRSKAASRDCSAARSCSAVEQYDLSASVVRRTIRPCDGPRLSDGDTSSSSARPAARAPADEARERRGTGCHSQRHAGWHRGAAGARLAPPVHLPPLSRYPGPGRNPAAAAAAPRAAGRRAERRRTAARRGRTAPPHRGSNRARSALELASLRQAFASLDGPFMTFEHCEVGSHRPIARWPAARAPAPKPIGPACPAAAPRRVDAGLRPRRGTLADRGCRGALPAGGPAAPLRPPPA